MTQYLLTSGDAVLAALRQHVVLALLPVLIGLAIALPLGYLAHRYRWLYLPLMGVGSTLYAVPSIALYVDSDACGAAPRWTHSIASPSSADT